MTSKKSTAAARKLGRPTRATMLKEAIDAVGVDPDAVDPRRVLASIAIDAEAPASARVAAAKALLSARSEPRLARAAASPAERDKAAAALDRRTRELMAAGRRSN